MFTRNRQSRSVHQLKRAVSLSQQLRSEGTNFIDLINHSELSRRKVLHVIESRPKLGLMLPLGPRDAGSKDSRLVKEMRSAYEESFLTASKTPFAMAEPVSFTVPSK